MNFIKISLCFFLIILALIGCPDKKKPDNYKNPVNNKVSENVEGPDIYIDGLKYKFGKILEGQNVVFTFYFKNTGTKDLVINELDVNCSCVIVKQYDKTVKPGERGKIYGIIETKGFLGEVIKAIKIVTNIPEREPYILTMEGEILTASQWMEYKKK